MNHHHYEAQKILAEARVEARRIIGEARLEARLAQLRANRQAQERAWAEAKKTLADILGRHK